MTKCTYVIECDMCEEETYVIAEESGLPTLFCPLCGTEGPSAQIDGDEDE